MIRLFLSLRSKPPKRLYQKNLQCVRGSRLGTLWPRRFSINAVTSLQTALRFFSLTLLPCVRPLHNHRHCSFVSRDRIIAPASERIATQDPPKPQRRSIEQTVLCHGFCCVFRTTGHKAAGDRKMRRNGAFIKPQAKCGQVLHLPRPRCTAANTCIISASS